MDIDELTDAFINAYDKWATSELESIFGKEFDDMVEARQRLEDAREQRKDAAKWFTE